MTKLRSDDTAIDEIFDLTDCMIYKFISLLHKYRMREKNKARNTRV